MTFGMARQIAKLYVFAFVLNIVLALAYAIYSSITGTGPSGYVMSVQLEWFGKASDLFTFISVTGFLMIPSMVLGPLLSRLSPEVASAIREMMIGKTAGSQQQRQTPAELSWRVILGATAGILFVTLVVSGALYVVNRQDRAAGIYEIDLDRAEASLPDGVAYAKLTGHLAHSYVAAYQERSSRSRSGSLHVFAPLTEANWSKDAPVRYFVHYTKYGVSADATQLPDVFQINGAARITGSLSNELPVFVSRKYAGQGLKIAPKYRVINLEPLPEGGAPMSYSHWIALGIGGFASIISLGALAGGKLLARRFVKRY